MEGGGRSCRRSISGVESAASLCLTPLLRPAPLLCLTSLLRPSPPPSLPSRWACPTCATSSSTACATSHTCIGNGGARGHHNAVTWAIHHPAVHDTLPSRVSYLSHTWHLFHSPHLLRTPRRLHTPHLPLLHPCVQPSDHEAQECAGLQVPAPSGRGCRGPPAGQVRRSMCPAGCTLTSYKHG